MRGLHAIHFSALWPTYPAGDAPQTAVAEYLNKLSPAKLLKTHGRGRTSRYEMPASPFEPRRIKWKITDGATAVDLAQVSSSVNRDGKYPDEEVGSHYQRLSHALQRIAAKPLAAALHFIVFPELTVPVRYLCQFLRDARRQFGGDTTRVLVAGIEMFHRHQLAALLAEVRTEWEVKYGPEISNAGEQQPINSALIAIFDDAEAHLFFQVKFAPSQFELDKNADFTLFLASRVPIFSLGTTEFLVALCSDWAVKKDDNTEPLSKHFARHREGRNAKRQAFVFNIQMNPSMESVFFAQSARDIFDSNLKVARSTVLVMCNAISAISNGGSKILASKKLSIASPENLRHVSLYPAEVSGLALGVDPGALRLILASPTSGWQPGPGSPNQYSSLHCDFGTSSHDAGLPVTVFAEPRGFLRSMAPADKIGKELSNMGHHDAAISLFQSVAEFHESSQDFFECARFQYLIGTEFRHQGRLNDADSWYHKARSSLQKFDRRPTGDKTEDKHQRLNGAIPAAKAILEVIWAGNQAAAVRSFSDAARNCALGNYGAKSLRKRDRAHCMRQIAEAYRLSGYFSRATRLYRRLARFYGHTYPEDYRYAQLGQANSLRDGGYLPKAKAIYEELDRFVLADDAERFKARLLMAQISYKITAKDKFDDKLQQLFRIARTNDLIFPKVYALLHSGLGELKKIATGEQASAEDARKAFREVDDICRSKRINGLDRKIELEAAIAALGIELANQLASESHRDQRRIFDRHAKNFEKLSFAWGFKLTNELCGPQSLREVVSNMPGLP